MLKKTCAICGAEFATNNSRQIYCCQKCGKEAIKRKKVARNAAYREKAREKEEKELGPRYGKAQGNDYVRACHDCGKPTTDYRCQSCRKKWQKKNGVGMWSD